MMMKAIALIPITLLFCACSTYTTPRYSINADTNVALKALGATSVAVGSFSGPKDFDANCRAAGPLAPPDGLSYTEYLKKALEAELKVAGAHTATSPRIVLTGTVNKLEFSSSRGLTGGSWDVELTLNSSNGSTLAAMEHYEFESGFNALTACKQTAEAYMPTIQNLIGKIVRSPDFRQLLQ
ncbi:MAG: hypothetical protein HZC23_03280 [Rhodocyclales bacterium]|nr:hypothetical protein [Rhodocyclales bacterium]